MTLEMVILQRLADVIKGLPVFYGNGYIQIFRATLWFIAFHQLHGYISCPGTYHIQWQPMLCHTFIQGNECTI